MTEPAERAELAAVAETLEAGLAQLDAVAAIHEKLGRAAAAVADCTVALLSLSPLVNRDPRALGFVSDAMGANAAAMTALHDLQSAASRVLDATAQPLAELLSDRHSRKV